MADNEQALELLPELPGRGALRAGRPALQRPGHSTPSVLRRRRELVATRRGRYPHTDGGVEVRRVFHKLRSRAIENFNEQFKGIFDAHGQVPTKGLVNTRRFALGAVLVYQLTLWYRLRARAGPPRRLETVSQGRLSHL